MKVVDKAEAGAKGGVGDAEAAESETLGKGCGLSEAQESVKLNKDRPSTAGANKRIDKADKSAAEEGTKDRE